MELETNKEGSLTTPRSHHLTPIQRAFVIAFVTKGLKCTEAARAAGCANPEHDGYELFRHKAVFTAISYEIEKMVIEACIPGIACLKKIIAEKATSATHKSVQVQAVKVLIAERDGARQNLAKREQSGGEGLASLSTDEIQDYIALKRAEQAETARLAGSMTAGNGQVLDAQGFPLPSTGSEPD